MAQLLNPFDATQVDPQGNSSQLPVSGPEGHKVVIVANEVKPTKDNEGGLLALTLQIIEGEHAGAQGEYRLNLYNKSEKAVEIAYKQLSAICHVTGVFQVLNADVLMNIPFIAIVGLKKKAKTDDPDYTEIKGVKDINGNDPGKQGQQQQQPQNNNNNNNNNGGNGNNNGNNNNNNTGGWGNNNNNGDSNNNNSTNNNGGWSNNNNNNNNNATTNTDKPSWAQNK